MDNTTADSKTKSRKVSFLLGFGIFFFPYVFSWFTLRHGHTRRSQIIAFSWAIIFIVSTLARKNESNNSSNVANVGETKAVPSMQSKAANPQIGFDSFELKIYNLVASEDIDAFALKDNYESMYGSFDREVSVATADQIQRAYEKNEVSGDKLYRGKPILVKGTITSISRSVGENYYLLLKGGSNQFIQPHASMGDGYTDYLADLEKGQKVALYCQGSGMMMGSAMLSECEPYNIWKARSLQKFLESQYEKAASADKNSQRFLATIAYIAAKIPQTSPCRSGNSEKKCMEDISKISSSVKNNIKKDDIDLAKIRERFGIKEEPKSLSH
jgi:hypothetical protein